MKFVIHFDTCVNEDKTVTAACGRRVSDHESTLTTNIVTCSKCLKALGRADLIVSQVEREIRV